MLQRDVNRAGHLVAQQGVAVAERAALYVLAGQANGHAVGQDGGEGQGLGRGPIDRGGVRVGKQLPAALQHAAQLAVGAEAIGQRQQRVVEGDERLGGDGRPCPAGRSARRGR